MDDGIVLNKFIAQSGVCSRRKAVELIKDGLVTVNGVVVSDPSYRVQPKDSVKCKGKLLKQESFSYILLNKPKGFVTTVSDEQGRKTVMDLLQGFADNRLYPVGRLDINTTGLLLLTNDGELAQRLSHPKFEVSKVYDITLDRPFAIADLEQVQKGLVLEDGKVNIDTIRIHKTNPKQVQIILHSGKNRIVRRIFEYFGYQVKSLDRIGYSIFSKKGLPLGSWRRLTNNEITTLKLIKR